MFLQDIRFGLRTALKNKGVTAIAILCLAIGIGLNTMMFSVVDGVLIKPLPYRDPEQHHVNSTPRSSAAASAAAACPGSICGTGRSARTRSARSRGCRAAVSR